MPCTPSSSFTDSTKTNSKPYIGRFAPSPTGKLHFGSLVAAVASYLDAKAHQGQWLLRMEDLDPPREEAGAADSILQSLEHHHLYWDQPVLYQSQRLDAYEETLEELRQYTYPCHCIRQRIIGLNGRYDGHCLKHPPPASDPTAIRLIINKASNKETVERFDDVFMGPQTLPLSEYGDFIIRRKDGLFAYQLAVAVDDAYQDITHVIRGHDLLDSTSRQRYILSLLGRDLPEYGHTPLALGKDGHKLSKQTKATPINNNNAINNLIAALNFLGYTPPEQELSNNDCSSLLEWATERWQRQQVSTHSSIAPQLSGA